MKGDVRFAILHACVQAWMEGHREGEDECPGCTHGTDKKARLLKHLLRAGSLVLKDGQYFATDEAGNDFMKRG
jgi:hypothetical protein